MTLTEFLRESIRNLHARLDASVEDLTDEQLYFRPEGKGNHIGFIIWHDVRTEDTMIQEVIQGKPSLWVSGEFDHKFGLDSNSRGGGMSADDAGKLRLPSIAQYMVYQKRVWEATDAYLASINDADLSETRSMPRRGDIAIHQILGVIVLGHGYTHIGDIQYIRGLQGL